MGWLALLALALVVFSGNDAPASHGKSEPDPGPLPLPPSPLRRGRPQVPPEEPPRR